MTKKSVTTIENTIIVDKWFEAKNVLHNIYENKINQINYEREKILLVVEFIKQKEPDCIIEYIKDDNGNICNIKLNYDHSLAAPVDKIIKTGKSPKAPKVTEKNNANKNK